VKPPSLSVIVAAVRFVVFTVSVTVAPATPLEGDAARLLSKRARTRPTTTPFGACAPRGDASSDQTSALATG
jgi:hypothetical protein